jgi:transcriptional regulator with XRE-family HTH domain
MNAQASKPRAASRGRTTSPRTASREKEDAAAPSLSSLGLRVRYARTMLGSTLKAVAEQAGCSESMLSKIECGLATPSLTMLHGIAQALQTNVAHLITVTDSAPSPVMRAGTRTVVKFDAKGADDKAAQGISLERLIPPLRGQLMQGDIHLLAPGAESGDVIRHQGEELGYVLSGDLELTIDGTVWRLHAGDSFYFPSDQPHSYRNPGRTKTRVLWVNTPPTF